MAKPKSRRRKPKPNDARSSQGALDLHSAAVTDSVQRQLSLMIELGGTESPAETLDDRIDAELATLRTELAPHRPERVIELGRV